MSTENVRVEQEELEAIKKSVLTSSRRFLVDNIDPVYHLSYLRSKFVFSERDAEEVNAPSSRSARAEVFLDILSRKGSVAYDEFQNSLCRDRTQLFLLTSMTKTLELLRHKVKEFKGTCLSKCIPAFPCLEPSPNPICSTCALAYYYIQGLALNVHSATDEGTASETEGASGTASETEGAAAEDEDTPVIPPRPPPENQLVATDSSPTRHQQLLPSSLLQWHQGPVQNITQRHQHVQYVSPVHTEADALPALSRSTAAAESSVLSEGTR